MYNDHQSTQPFYPPKYYPAYDPGNPILPLQLFWNIQLIALD